MFLYLQGVLNSANWNKSLLLYEFDGLIPECLVLLCSFVKDTGDMFIRHANIKQYLRKFREFNGLDYEAKLERQSNEDKFEILHT